MTGDAELDAIIARVTQIADLGRVAAPDVAKAVEAEVHRTIAAGTTPDGAPWLPTQRGGRPLQHAANAVRVAAVGSSVVIRITGPDANHSRGAVRGGIKRQVIPSGALPAPMAAVIKAALDRKFREVAGG